jgi:hypothetical protein
MTTCRTGKARFRSQDSAENTLRDMTRSKRWTRRVITGRCEIRAYHCQMCDGWHLTSQRPDYAFENLDYEPLGHEAKEAPRP